MNDLLLYLESQIVLHQGLLNENQLSAADRQQIQLWVNQNLMELQTIKNPPNVQNPMFTHRIRLSDTLFMKAWQIRYEKAAQFSAPIPSAKSEKDVKAVKKLTDLLPNVTLYLLTHPQEELPKPEQPAVTFKEYEAFLEMHGHQLMPAQKDVAEQIFNTLGQTRHRAFINIPRSGKTWLLKTIDQFLTWHKNQTKN